MGNQLDTLGYQDIRLFGHINIEHIFPNCSYYPEYNLSCARSTTSKLMQTSSNPIYSTENVFARSRLQLRKRVSLIRLTFIPLTANAQLMPVRLGFKLANPFPIVLLLRRGRSRERSRCIVRDASSWIEGIIGRVLAVSFVLLAPSVADDREPGKECDHDDCNTYADSGGGAGA